MSSKILPLFKNGSPQNKAGKGSGLPWADLIPQLSPQSIAKLIRNSWLAHLPLRDRWFRVWVKTRATPLTSTRSRILIRQMILVIANGFTNPVRSLVFGKPMDHPYLAPVNGFASNYLERLRFTMLRSITKNITPRFSWIQAMPRRIFFLPTEAKTFGRSLGYHHGQMQIQKLRFMWLKARAITMTSIIQQSQIVLRWNPRAHSFSPLQNSG